MERFTPILVTGILVTIVLILVVLLYGLVAGVINPPAPRTAEEFMLVRAKSMVEAAPTNGQYWADYVDVLVKRGADRQAEEIIGQARESVGTDPSILLVNNAELRLLLAQDRNEEVLTISDKFLKQDADLMVKQLADYAAKGINAPADFNKARTAVTIDTLSLRSLAAVALKRYDVAIETLEPALELDPYAADLATFLGNVYLLKGDAASLELARNSFNYALAFIPDSEAALDGLAEVNRLSKETTATP